MRQVRGTVAMANEKPNENGSQFYARRLDLPGAASADHAAQDHRAAGREAHDLRPRGRGARRPGHGGRGTCGASRWAPGRPVRRHDVEPMARGTAGGAARAVAAGLHLSEPLAAHDPDGSRPAYETIELFQGAV